MSAQEIIRQLLPDGAIPKNIQVEPAQREHIIGELRSVRRAIRYGRQAQQGAFILAAMDVDYDENRDYLLHVLSGCNYPAIRYGCDDMTGFYLIYLWEHGHKEILLPLLKTSVDSYNAAGSEAMGAYFGNLVERSPQEFLDAVRTFEIPMQMKACYFAGSADGGGLGERGLATAKKQLRRIGGPVAQRCLAQIEDANKPQ